MKPLDVALWALIAFAGYALWRSWSGSRAGLVHVQRVQQVAPDFVVGQGAAAPGMTWEWDEIEGAWNQRPQVWL